MRTPVLIIGSGLAGLSTAYRLSQKGIPCLVVTKDEQLIEGTNSVYAQGGIIYKAADESPEQLIEDILAAGDQINAEAAVRQLAVDGVEYVKGVLMDEVQVPFDRSPDGEWSLTQEAAHSKARIVHVKDYTGRAIMDSLLKAVQKTGLVNFLSGHILIDVLTSGHHCAGYEFKYQKNRCLGAYLYDIASGQVKTVLAEATVLCTGGVGQIYEYHTNAEHAYGAGLAAANRARVRIINARFVQFHPTALWTPRSGRRFLISEALRGEGARLMNLKGETFMDAFQMKELESRAVVSRAVIEEMKKTGDSHVLLNLADHYTGSEAIPQRFPSIYEACLQEGIDISRDPIPVVPAAHFFCGGIAVDLNGKTELDGLYAAGEVACSGVHGANRLASTSLLECLTWGIKAGDEMIDELGDQGIKNLKEQMFATVEEWQVSGTQQADLQLIEKEKDRIRSLMWQKVGVIRHQQELFEAKRELQEIWTGVEKLYFSSALSEPLIELRHMAETAWIITNSASSHTNLKKDSLGGHVLSGG